MSSHEDSNVLGGDDTRWRQQQQEEEERRFQKEDASASEDQEEHGVAACVDEECEDDAEEEEDDDDEDSGSDEKNVVSFGSDEEAIAARASGIKLYNEHHYEEALDIQYCIVRHFEKKYGATSPICGPYFLDYGLSQLRLIQSKSTMEAALQPLDQDVLKTCFINLEVARVCFQKQEQERGEGDLEVQLHQAEVHNAIAQLHIEREDIDEALKEYESELFTYRFIQQEMPDALPFRRLAAVLYSIADCYMREGDFEGAEERFASALNEIASFPAGTIPSELVAELEELREDAREMKGGKFKELQESIQEQFAVKEAEQLPTAQEFFGSTDEELQQHHPYVSRLPGDAEYSALSMPQSVTNPVQWNEHSNSMSLSLFPPQVNVRGSELSNSQPVQHVVARRKPKRSEQQKEEETRGTNPTGESDSKRIRTES